MVNQIIKYKQITGDECQVSVLISFITIRSGKTEHYNCAEWGNDPLYSQPCIFVAGQTKTLLKRFTNCLKDHNHNKFITLP